MQLAVLNAEGNDPEQMFPDGAGPRDAAGHAPVNYHAYAACTRGGFFQRTARIPATMEHVLVLLRKDLRPALRAVEALVREGRTVAISWKESGPFQIAHQLESRGAQELFRQIAALAHGALASTPEAEAFYHEAGAREVGYVPTPYPVDDPRWDFNRPLEERTGIYLGTREWKVPSRRHEEALREALQLGVPVYVVNEDGWLAGRRLRAMGVKKEHILHRQDYPGYLAAMARSRVVFQRDASAVPGQIAGDALLCRLPCLGGNGAVDREAFGEGDEAPTLEALLRDDACWRETVQRSQEKARARLSFQAGAEQLRTFFAHLAA